MSEIDFTEKLPATAEFLSNPKATDLMKEIYNKIKRLNTIFEQGKGLAIHTGHRSTISNISNSPTEGVNTLTPLQFPQYKAYLDGASMPNIDWQNCNSSIPHDADSHFYQQVEAVREIFRNPQLCPENASWFLSNHAQEMPLVDAVVKVRSAQHISDFEQHLLTGKELAELPTICEALSVAEDRFQQEQQLARQLIRMINQSAGILLAHVQAIGANAVDRNEEIADDEAVKTKEFVKVEDEGSVDEMKNMPII